MSSEAIMLDGAAGSLALHQLSGGDDSAHTLLIGHANGFPARAYRAFARALGDDIRVFALDFRAHGESAAPDDLSGFAWAGMTEDLQTATEYLATLGSDKPHGFGHSLGGAAMIDLERKHPGTFASVFTFEPVMAPKGAIEADSKLTRSAEGRLKTFPSKEAALMRYSARRPLSLFRADVLFDYVQHGFVYTPDGSVTLACKPEHEAEIYRQGADTIHLDQARDVETEIVIGRSGDGGLAASLGGPIVELLAKGRIVDFPDLTHFGPLQDPVGVANAVRANIGS